MSVVEEIRTKGHEQVAFFQDHESGAQAIIAVHSTVLGPALGGCRMHLYETFESALADVLRLSEGMTYKNSLAGLNLGGGKAVLIADRATSTGRENLFRAFGRFVHSLGGRYLTAEDMGTSVRDMNAVLESTPFVTGRDPKIGGGGDPSPFTALGVFCGIRACLERVYGTSDVQGRKVAVQGVGHVGKYLVDLLLEAGAKVVLSDTRSGVLDLLRASANVEVVSPDAIHQVECDVFSPNAIGGVINSRTVPELRCKVIAGGANNQLEDDSSEKALQERGILYAPDFAINAGGVILCYDELEPGGFSEKRVRERVQKIYLTIGRILDESASSGLPPGAVAVKLARERIEIARRAQV